MKKRNPIVVKLGEEQKKMKDEQLMDKPSIHQIHKEHATTSELDNDIEPYARNYQKVTGHKKRVRIVSKKLKPILFAVTSAIIIGSLLGFLLLGLFVNIGKDLNNPSGASPVTNPTTATNDNNDEETETTEHTSSVPIPILQAFILQGGVFSELANANDAALSFKDEGMPTIVWERDEQYYVIVGLGDTKENGQSIAEDIEQDTLEVFVKEWSTKPLDTELTSDELQWMESFQEQWQRMVVFVSNKETISIDELETLYQTYPSDSSLISEFVENTAIFKDELVQSSHQKVASGLLEIWKAYEETFK